MSKFVHMLFVLACLSGSPKSDATPQISFDSLTAEPVIDPPHVHTREDTSEDCSEVLVLPSLSRGSKVMLVGDSLAVGMSREFRRIAKLAGYVPITHAKVGSSTPQWLKWIKADLKTHKPQLVVVSLGSNDAAGYRMVERDPEMYRRLVDTVLESDSFIVWISPPAIKLKRLPKIEEVRKIIKEAVPIYYPSEDLDLRLEDGIHTNAEGYARWARSVWRQMSDMMITYDFE